MKCSSRFRNLSLSLCLGLIAATLPHHWTASQERKKKPDADYATLIHELGDPDFSKREKAQRELLRLGEKARQHVAKAAKSALNAERLRRLKTILHLLDRRRLASATVHVFGLYQATSQQHFRSIHPGLADVNLSEFCRQLANKRNAKEAGPAKRLWELFPRKTQVIMSNKDLLARIDRVRKRQVRPLTDPKAERAAVTIRDALESTLRRKDFYDSKSFAGIKLDGEARELVKRRKDLSLLETWVLNRRLFEASFPKLVKKSPYTLKDATVPVRVMKSNDPVILVLCSYESVHWKIRPDKGANIAKVIVGGYHLSDVVGTKAPTEFHSYEHPNQKQYFYAYKRNDQRYRRLEAALMRLTGKDISSFDGRYQYKGGKPFVAGGAPEKLPKDP